MLSKKRSPFLGLTQRWPLPALSAFGLVLAIAIIKLQPSLAHDTQNQTPAAVKVITAEQHTLKPSIVGYGTVKPSLELQALAEVSGRITYLHPELEKGAFLARDTHVITIDDKDYLLSLKQAEADLLAAKANLQEIELTIKNNALELTLANEKLKVRKAELARLATLRKNGNISQSQLDQERQAMLVQQQEVQQLENKRTTLPSQREVLATKIAIAQAQVEQSQRNLDRTQIRLPFNGRVSDVYVEQDQYVSTGTKIFDAVGMNKVAVNAQFPIGQFGRFAAHIKRPNIDMTNPEQFSKMRQLLSRLGLSASIEIAGENYKSWQADVERINDDLDPNTGTVGVVVTVKNSYQQVEPGVRPPLLEGMYMRVVLQGEAGQFIALPRFALQNKQVFSVTPNGLLQRIELQQIYYQGELALFPAGESSAIAAGAKIIVSDVFPAVEGMAVSPIEDIETKQQMSLWLEQAQ